MCDTASHDLSSKTHKILVQRNRDNFINTVFNNLMHIKIKQNLILLLSIYLNYIFPIFPILNYILSIVFC